MKKNKFFETLENHEVCVSERKWRDVTVDRITTSVSIAKSLKGNKWVSITSNSEKGNVLGTTYNWLKEVSIYLRSVDEVDEVIKALESVKKLF